MDKSNYELKKQEAEQNVNQQQFNYNADTQAETINDSIQDQIYIEEEEQRNYGKMIPLLKDQHNNPRYILGPHYFIFIPTVLICICFLQYCLEIFYTKLNFDIYSMIVCSFVSLFFIISYIRVGFSDPGIASKSHVPSMGTRIERSYCRPCKVLKTNETRHCYYCDVCILEMDHHCVWVGKCIGKNNWTAFKIFIISVILTMLIFCICIFFSAKQTPIHVI